MRAEKLRWAIEYRLKKLQPGIEWQLEFSNPIELNARVDNLVLDNMAVIYINGYAELLIFDCRTDDPLLNQIDIMPFNRPDVEAQSFNSLFDFELFLEGFLAYYWRE